MGDFFRSTRFKILLAVLLILFAFMLRAAWTGGLAPLTSQVLGMIASPFQKVSASISQKSTEFFDTFLKADEIAKENEALKEKMRELNQKLVDFDKYKQENAQLREFLEIKEENPDFDFEPATVIGRDPSDRFYSFTIDKGSLSDISPRDTVITSDGLVGVVTEVGLTYAKVLTILDVSIEVAAYDTRTKDIGIVTGRIDLASEGKCQMTLLPRESGASKGDLVVTSGFGGLYPKGLIIGEIEEVKTESHGISLFAVIEPTADIKNVKDVLVIKSFKGQADQSAQGN